MLGLIGYVRRKVAEHFGVEKFARSDETDADALCDLGLPVALTRILMLSLEDREALARAVLEAAGRGF